MSGLEQARGIAIAQVNPVVGDVAHNLALARRAIACAVRQGAELVVFPEMVIPGYPPRDLLYEEAFVREVTAATAALAADTLGGPAVVVGTIAPSGRVTPHHPGLFGCAAVLERGEVQARVAKQLLPAYDVFHEPRWFVPGPPSAPIDVAGRRIGLLVCEDLWDEGYPVHPARSLAEQGAALLVCLSASPYREGVHEARLEQARRVGRPLVYVNMVGAQDELIFDGGSFVVDAEGRLAHRLPAFEEEVATLGRGSVLTLPSEVATFDALVLGVRDFARKNGLRRAFLGLSGGIDSALVACIAARALGPSNVMAVALPGRFTDLRSTDSARDLAESLGIGFDVIPIEGPHGAFEAALGATSLEVGENLQARVRATLLMARVNAAGGLLLNTSNKTELALGYGTMYGDMAGALAVVGDLTKPQVYALAHGYVARGGCIPPFILERAPSAELRPQQVDPFDYSQVGPEVEARIVGSASASRWDREIRRAEHKRWQAPLVLKVTDRAFGTGRMVPITHRDEWRNGDDFAGSAVERKVDGAPRARGAYDGRAVV